MKRHLLNQNPEPRHKPRTFEAHATVLLASFRTAIPQAAAIFPHLSNDELAAFKREIALLHARVTEETTKRGL